MSKYINILAAVILLASCTKTEVTYDAPSEIAFAPAAAVMTKAGEAAYVGGQLNVFAYTGSTPYFANVTFLDTDTGEDGEPVNDGEYVGTPTQYWPNTKSLRFAGYTGDKYDDDKVTYNGTSLTINGYQQDGTKDLMWFITDEIDAKGDVEPILYHACAKITINVTGEDNCASWPITDMTLNALYKSGKVTFTSTSTTNSADWTDRGTNGTQNIFSGSTTIQGFGSVEAIVIPQTPVTLSVTYNGKTTNPAIPLNYNGNKAWEAGKNYIYNLHFLNPYKIEFSVSGVETWGVGGTITMQ